MKAVYYFFGIAFLVLGVFSILSTIFSPIPDMTISALLLLAGTSGIIGGSFWIAEAIKMGKSRNESPS